MKKPIRKTRRTSLQKIVIDRLEDYTKESLGTVGTRNVILEYLVLTYLNPKLIHFIKENENSKISREFITLRLTDEVVNKIDDFLNIPDNEIHSRGCVLEYLVLNYLDEGELINIIKYKKTGEIIEKQEFRHESYRDNNSNNDDSNGIEQHVESINKSSSNTNTVDRKSSNNTIDNIIEDYKIFEI